MSNRVTYSTPSKFLFNAGIVSVGGTNVASSEGGITVEIEDQVVNEPFDGKASPIEGLDRFAGHTLRLRGKFKSMSEAFLQQLHPGASSDGSSPVNTYTPLGAHIFFTAGTHYLNTVKFVGDRADGVTAGYAMDRAVVTTKQLQTRDAKGEAGGALWDITIESRLSATAAASDIRTAPYTFFVNNT